MLAGGRESPLWQALKKHGVDLYLCGEARTVACTQADGVLLRPSIAGTAGAALGRGCPTRSNYLVATVYPDRIDLEVKEIAIIQEGGRQPGPSAEDSNRRRRQGQGLHHRRHGLAPSGPHRFDRVQRNRLFRA